MVLKNQLSTASLKSVGLMELQEFLTEFTNSSAFLLLTGDTKDLLAELDEVTYCIHVKDLRIEVRPTIGGKPYSKEVEYTFKIFEREPEKDYKIEFLRDQGISYVQASILEGVAQLYPNTFQNLEDYNKDHKNFLNKTLKIFDREIQFYMAYLD